MVRKKWLPSYSFTIMDKEGKPHNPVYRKASQSLQLFDLTDTLRLYDEVAFPYSAYIELKGQPNARRIAAKWTEAEIKKIEDIFWMDLNIDGLNIDFVRLSPLDRSTKMPFMWRLDVTDPSRDEIEDGEAEISSRPNQVASRYRRARSDASIPSMVTTIESTFGLPEGCVQIVYPSGNRARRNATVRTIRKQWSDI